MKIWYLVACAILTNFSLWQLLLWLKTVQAKHWKHINLELDPLHTAILSLCLIPCLQCNLGKWAEATVHLSVERGKICFFKNCLVMYFANFEQYRRRIEKLQSTDIFRIRRVVLFDTHRYSTLVWHSYDMYQTNILNKFLFSLL